MKDKLFVSSLLNFRNISLFLLALFLLMSDQYQPLGQSPLLTLTDTSRVGVSVLFYMCLTLQSFTSKKFQDSFLHKQKIKQIKHLNYECMKLFAEVKKNTNTNWLQRMKKIMEDRNDIVNSFFKGERNFLKEKIVEQALSLVVSYLKLINNFCIRSRELSTMDVSEIASRINMNSRKLNFTKDAYAAEDLKKVIQMDERIIDRLKEEKKDLERINTKLDYMESIINMFKHQIISNIESEEMLEKLETAVNEAEALDSVLHERRRNRVSM